MTYMSVYLSSAPIFAFPYFVYFYYIRSLIHLLINYFDVPSFLPPVTGDKDPLLCDMFERLDSKVKAAFTRTYNSTNHNSQVLKKSTMMMFIYPYMRICSHLCVCIYAYLYISVSTSANIYIFLHFMHVYWYAHVYAYMIMITLLLGPATPLVPLPPSPRRHEGGLVSREIDHHCFH